VQAVRRVDLRDADGDAATRRRFFETLCDDLQETGFVRVVGHGVDPALVARSHEGGGSR
jgi:isopenicillin N synthase-like dioxygenase